MALIKCNECGKEFSDKANACPNCACPTELIIKDNAINNEKLTNDNYDFIKNTLIKNNYSKAKTILECRNSLQISQEEIKVIVDKLANEYYEKQNQKEKNALSAEQKYKLEHPELYDEPKCPNCHSTNIKSINIINKSISIGFWGLASHKIGKTMECLNCKYKW